MGGDGEEFSFIGRAETEVVVVDTGRHGGVKVLRRTSNGQLMVSLDVW